MAGQIFQGVDNFLGHSTSAGSAGYLKNWKDDGQLNVVLHPRGQIAILWAHRWYRVAKEKDSDKTRLFPMRFNSMEKEAILKRQHFRNDDGTREFPPEVCPFSLLLEWVREQIEDDKINWLDPIFQIQSDKEDVDIMAGGFTGLFQSRKLTDDQKAELKKAKVRVDEAYKENGGAKANYVFCVVQYDEPGDGCLIAMEGKALGQKMQKAIRDEQAKWKGSKTPEKGNPFTNPFVFQWSYDEKGSFDDAYDVVAIPNESMPITDEIQAVFDEEPPDLKQIVDPSNVALLRASFEENWVHEVVPPWNDIFGAAEERVKGTPAAELPEDFKFGANADPKRDTKTPDRSRVDTSGKAPTVVGMKTQVQQQNEAVADDDIACDICHKVMKETEFTCPHCGAAYDPQTGMLLPKTEPPKEEPKRTRSRSEAKSESTAEPVAGAKDVDAEKPKRRR